MAYNMVLLQYVQKTLNAMHSDSVNSIADTEESFAIANYCQDSYFQLVEKTKGYNFDMNLTQLYGASDLTQPVKLLVPDFVVGIDYFQYNCTTTEGQFQYQDVQYLDPPVFLSMTQARTNSSGPGVSDIVRMIIDTGSSIFIYNDRPPEYYTAFNDQTIYCDAFNSNVENSLMQSKTQIFAKIRQEFKLEDDFIPNLPYNMQQVLLQETIKTSTYLLRGERNLYAESYSKSIAQRAKFTAVKTGVNLQIARYGRRRRGYGGYGGADKRTIV